MKHMNPKLLALCLILALSAGLLAGCGKKSSLHPARELHYDLTSGFQVADGKNELVQISENDRFVLYANLKRGEAAVKDKTTGRTWYTNPEDKNDDMKASGFYKNSLLSVLTVVYNTSLSVEMTCASYMSAVTKDGLFYRVEPDGSIIFLFDFIKEEFQIPVRFAIEEDCFSATILTENVVEYGPNTIKTIDLLPFFGAGGTKDEGYLLVPDGSGALIWFNNGRTEATTFQKALYGFDNGTSDKVMGGAVLSGFFTLSENASLPVFGLASGSEAFLGVIAQGQARASVNANVSGKYTSYNTVWTTYSYRTSGTVRQIQKDGSDLAVTVSEKRLETWSDYEVRYYFPGSGKTDLADLAATYRNILLAQGALVRRVEDGDLPLYLETYGYLRKQKSFLGLPVQAKITMTSFEDTGRILDSLEAGGIENVIVKYSYWARDSFYDKIPLLTAPDARVGTAAQLSSLKARLEAQGGALYLGTDLLNIYKTGRGIGETNDVLQSVAGTVQRQYEFRLDTANTDSRYEAWYLLRPSRVPDVYADYLERFTKAGFSNLAADSLGSMLYSELSSRGTGRSEALWVWTETARRLSEGLDGLMLEGGSDFTAVYATHVLRSASGCSQYDLEDLSVPFWQMVFHGYVSYSLEPMNLSSGTTNHFLTSLEYGAAPLYALVGENVDELIGSRLSNLYSADAAVWSEAMQKQYAQLNAILGASQTAVITGYEILSDTLRHVSYADGLELYVNYAAEPAQAAGVSIPAKGFAAFRDGQLVTATAAAGGI